MQPMPLEICTKAKSRSRKGEGDVVDLLVTPATKSKPSGREDTAQMADCNKCGRSGLWITQAPCRKMELSSR
jgi:hypothetical protein